MKIDQLSQKLLFRRRATPVPSEPDPAVVDRVRAMYRHILHREADEGGLAGYVNMLRGGASDLDVAMQLLTSEENLGSGRTAAQQAAAIVVTGTMQGGLDEPWCDLLAYLADHGQLPARGAAKRAGGRRPSVVGRVATDADGKLTVWAINLAAPDLPVDVVLTAGGRRFAASTLDGADGLAITVPRDFAADGLDTLAATADGVPIVVDLAEASVTRKVAQRLAPKSSWFRDTLARGNAASRLSATSVLDVHDPAAPDTLPDHMRHVLAQRHPDGLDALTEDERARLLEWYVIDFREQWNGSGPFPMSERLCAYLQAPALAPEVSSNHVTRLAMLFWKRHVHEDRALFDRDAFRTMVYRLVSSPNGGIPSFMRACGDRLLGVLRQMHPSSFRLPIGVNWYWHIALTEESKVANLADLPVAHYLASTFQKLCYALATGNQLGLIPNDWLKFWSADGEAGLTRAEWQIAQLLLGPQASTERVRDWFERFFYAKYPQFRVLSAAGRGKTAEPTILEAIRQCIEAPAAAAPRLYVVGHTNTTGLGANLWMSVDALRTAGIEPVVASVDAEQIVLERAGIESATPLERPVVLFHVNADRAPSELARLPEPLQREAYRIGFFLWETSVPPDTHMLGLNLMDEIWVPTEYLAEIYRRCTSRPVHVVRKGLRPPAAVERVGRSVLGLGADDFVFLAIGDFHSSIPRKHPLAAVQAFRRAFPGRDDVKLILKIRNIDPTHWSNRGGYWQRVEREIAEDDRIRVLDTSLSEPEYWGLIDDCDAFVSLHRSEGFGYGIAHAMMRRKPVVVSDYSGSRDFCTEDTACLVPVREIPVGRYEMPTEIPGATWAEPDIARAAERLREVVDGGAAVDRRVEAARALIAGRYCVESQARTYAGRLASAGVMRVEAAAAGSDRARRTDDADATRERSVEHQPG